MDGAVVQHGWMDYVQAGGLVTQLTGAILLVMSVLSWYWILLLLVRQQARVRQRRNVERALLGAMSLEDVRERLHRDTAESVYGAMLSAALNARRHLPRLAGAHSTATDYVSRMLAQVLEREQLRLERGLTVLASIGSSAPFIGLFGTVVGIYRALINIGTAGSASLDTVALPVGEALVMTALGLAVAIPAVLGYNAGQRGVRTARGALEDLGYTLHAHVCVGVPLSDAPPLEFVRRPVVAVEAV